MADYVENGYSSDYVEGDTPPVPASVVQVDLTEVLNELSLIKAQNVDLNEKMNLLLSAINSNKTLSLSIVDNTVSCLNKLDNLPQNTLTLDDIKSIVPMVDDINLKVFPIGTKVTVTGYDSVCTVVGSHYLPDDLFTYVVVYTVSHIVDGVVRNSNFLSQQVVKYYSQPDSTIGDGGLTPNGG